MTRVLGKYNKNGIQELKRENRRHRHNIITSLSIRICFRCVPVRSEKKNCVFPCPLPSALAPFGMHDGSIMMGLGGVELLGVEPLLEEEA
jgi:hypothetical protein